MEIASGCVLPLTVIDKRKREQEEKQVITKTQNTMDRHVNKGAYRFSNLVMNKMVGMWAVQTSKPWLRIDDEALCACFQYANPAAQLFGRTWLARAAHQVYLGKRSLVISELQVSLFLQLFHQKELSLNFLSSFCFVSSLFYYHQALDSKIGLIMDVWTSPQNKYRVISASVTFLNKDWNFVTRHLSMKIIARHHKGNWLAEPMINVLVKHKLYSKISFFQSVLILCVLKLTFLPMMPVLMQFKLGYQKLHWTTMKSFNLMSQKIEFDALDIKSP